ncbi:MAG: hypothetical protein KGO92_02465 [Bacteroidota bacterium]|nr:hypothetical protein [Bacteroidota bacterium]
MQNNNQTVVDFFAVVYEANCSFQSLNRIIRKYNYEIDLIPLDLFERSFRHLYNLETFEESLHQQQVSLWLKTDKGPDKEIFISEEFYATLSAYYSVTNPFFEQGYVMMCTTRKVFPALRDGAKIDRGIVIQDLEKMKKFTDNLESSLHLARYGYVAFHSHFARIHSENSLIPLMDAIDPLGSESQRNFIEKDNALIEALLNIDFRITDYMQLTIKAFEESFHIKNQQVKFLHLINCLEICFSTELQDASITLTARYCAILLAASKREFISLYADMIQLFALKKEILAGNVTEKLPFDKKDEFCQQLVFLEETTRNVIKKILYLNCKSKEELFYKLDLKTLPGEFGQPVSFPTLAHRFHGKD